MRVYHERLRVPYSWWLLGLAVIAILGTELVAGLGWLFAVIVYGSLGGGYAAMLTSWGRARIDVSPGELRAGKARLPLSAAGEISELDEAQTRALRGPRADPAALVLIRPYLRRAVYVEVADQALGTPYWLLGSRRPAELAAAIKRSLPAARAGGAVG